MTFHLTIARKLFGLSLLAVLSMVGVGVAGLYARHFLTVGADRVLAAQEVLRQQMEADQAHDALRADVLAALLSANDIDANAARVVRRDLDAHRVKLAAALAKVQAADLGAAARAVLNQAAPALQAYSAQAAKLADQASTDRPGAQAQLEAFLAQFKQLESDMTALSNLIAVQAQDAEADSRAISERTGHLVTVGLVSCALLLLAAGWSISRGVVRRLEHAVQVARTVATGDLGSRIEVQGHDEAAQLLAALAAMNDNLVQLVGTVRESSDSIAAGTTQIAGGNQDLSVRTEEQASNLQQTAASMEQISATVRANADNTRQASAMAATASASAARSGDAVRRLIDAMAGITEASRRMTDIIGVIDGIAFQTNILALNAAVEAARAGEQGRGFAVVASEVRALAQRSAAAAKDIKGLIDSSVAQIRGGQEQAQDAGASMAEVVQQVQRVTALLSEINNATLEQNNGMVEVSRAVSHIDQVTQSNASLVEEAAAAAASLNRQAERLVQAVSQFRLGTGTGTALVPVA